MYNNSVRRKLKRYIVGYEIVDGYIELIIHRSAEIVVKAILYANNYKPTETKWCGVFRHITTTINPKHFFNEEDEQMPPFI